MRPVETSAAISIQLSCKMSLMYNADEWIRSLDEELAQKVALFKGGVCIAQIDGGRAQPKCRKRYP